MFQMIEVVASMARGPVFLAGELMECLITFTNPMSHLSTSASRLSICHLFRDNSFNDGLSILERHAFSAFYC